MNNEIRKVNFMLWIVKNILPHKLVYWCGVVLFANGTTGDYRKTIASELTMFDALDRWKKNNVP